MAKSRSLEWNKARRTNVRDRISSPNRDSGSGGDIEVRPTPDGVKLFAKLGARWYSTLLSEGNTLNISKSVEEDIASNTLSFSSNVNITEKVGIGTTAPTAGSMLHVFSGEGMTASVGQVIIENNQGATDNDTMLQLDWSGDADIHTGITAKFISFHDSGGEIGYITTAGDGSVNAITTSDARLKKNIRDTDINGLSIINSVKIRDFEWNDKKDKYLNGKTVQAQYVADELYEVYPLATSGTPGKMKDILDDDGNKTGEEIDPMGVGETRLVSVLIKAVQELSVKVTALEASKLKE